MVQEVEVVEEEVMAGKKIYRSIICLLLCLTSLNIPTIKAKVDAGYVYDELNVIVSINEAKEYHVEEHMVIDFQKEMHGIIRDIPKSNHEQDVGIIDVKVAGMPYHIQESGDLMEITIGDRNQLVKGKKEIVLSYTLTHDQDEDETYDDAYINVLGDDYDTEIKQFHAQINYPHLKKPQQIEITSGYRNAMNNPYTTYTTENQQLNIVAKKKIPPKVGISAHLRFEEGTFSQAPHKVYPYTIQDMKTEIQVDEVQDFHVTQTFTYNSIVEKTPYRMPLIHKDWNTKSYSIKNLQVEGSNYNDYISEIDLYLEKGTHTISVQYLIHPYHIMDDAVTLIMNQQDAITRIEQYTCTIDMPYLPELSMRIQHQGSGNLASQIQKTNEDGKVYLKSTKAIQPQELFTLMIPLKKAYFHRDTSIPNIAFYLLIPMFFIYLMMRLMWRTKPPITPVNFYPPQGINSAQAGYIIDMKLTETDITSLIFYWADQGYLRIHQQEESYAFEKCKDIDRQAPAYEQKLFHQMFSYGNDGYVTKQQLMYRFYDDIMNANDAIVKYYQGDEALRDRLVERIRIVCMCLSWVPLFIYVFYRIYDVYSDISKVLQTLLPFSITIPLILACYVLSRKAKKNHKTFHHIFFLSITIFMLIILVFSLAVDINITFLMIFLASIILFIIAKGIHKDSAYRKQLLTSLLGFKEFIQTVEKDKLEMMLQEDPAYYYHVLPYAQVLHVSDIWMDKFKDLALEQPDWYVGKETYHYAMMAHITQSIQHDMKQTMHASIQTSGSKAFSSHGGGAVGGGSGGGGSHGW